jgi:hypothetical protein
MLEKAKRPGDLRRSTFSWCRSTRISASSAARDRKRPAKAHQISLQRSIIAASINRFAHAYQPTLVSGRDRGQQIAVRRLPVCSEGSNLSSTWIEGDSEAEPAVSVNCLALLMRTRHRYRSGEIAVTVDRANAV